MARWTLKLLIETKGYLVESLPRGGTAAWAERAHILLMAAREGGSGQASEGFRNTT